MHPLRLLVAERPLIAGDGLAGWLGTVAGLSIAGRSEAPERIAEDAGAASADLLVLDLNTLPAGTHRAIVPLRRQAPELRILALYSGGERDLIGSVIAAGADGFVERVDSRQQLVDILFQVGRGESYFDGALSRVFDEAHVLDFEILSPAHWDLDTAFSPGTSEILEQSGLTEREKEILRNVATGHSSQAIAEELGITVPTVRKHRENLMRKLGLHNAAAVTAFALRAGLIGHQGRPAAIP